MLARLKQAALVLMGYRPAEVRYDEDDMLISNEIAARLARIAVQGDHLSEDALDMMIDRAIHEYATWEERRTRGRRNAYPWTWWWI